MDSFKVEFKRSAEKDLRRLPPQAVKLVVAQIAQLKDEPFPSQSLKLTDTERLYRLRVGDYRIIYEVDAEAHTIVIHYIRHRKDAYRK